MCGERLFRSQPSVAGIMDSRELFRHELDGNLGKIVVGAVQLDQVRNHRENFDLKSFERRRFCRKPVDIRRRGNPDLGLIIPNCADQNDVLVFLFRVSRKALQTIT